MPQQDAGGPGRVSDATFIVIGFEQLSVTNGAAVSLTAAKYDGAEHAAIQVDTQNVRYRDDGTDPTTAIGILLAAGLPAEVYPGPLADFSMIAETGTAAVNISYRKRI